MQSTLMRIWGTLVSRHSIEWTFFIIASRNSLSNEHFPKLKNSYYWALRVVHSIKALWSLSIRPGFYFGWRSFGFSSFFFFRARAVVGGGGVQPIKKRKKEKLLKVIKLVRISSKHPNIKKRRITINEIEKHSSKKLLHNHRAKVTFCVFLLFFF